MKKFLFVIVFGIYSQINAQELNPQSALNKVNKRFFIENKGQWHSDVLYLCKMGGLDAWITKYGVNYTFYKVEKNPIISMERQTLPKSKFDREELENSTLIGHRVLFELQGHNPNPATQGKEKQEGYYNYFIGNDKSKHANYVGLYEEAVVKNVYEGIDIRYYFDKEYLRYDYVVHPYADPSQIQFKLRGQYNAYSKGEDKLIFTTRFGEVQMAELKTYQQDKTIASKFVQQGDTWQIAVSNYDKTQTLIIDPLIYSTYLGGSDYDIAYSITLDALGSNAYITGEVYSTDYDITAGAFQTTYGGGFGDVFVTKLNATGTALVYSTYIGGNSNDYGYSIVLDGLDNVYVTGGAFSLTYPTTTGAFQTSKGGSWDIIVTKLNATGSALVYSTYIGGTGNDYGYSIAIDASSNTYITGFTESTDYDVTAGVFQTTLGGGKDVFVTKLNSTGTALDYSTYIGGTDNEEGYSIVIQGSGQAYITGRTNSTNYDITTGAYQTTYGGGTSDAFVTKLNPTGTTLVYSTYIGGSNLDEGKSIVIDISGNAYITGFTQSVDYATTVGAFQTTYGGGTYDVFVTKLNTTGTSLAYSTYIGGSGYDEGYDITIDGSGNAYVTGYTESTNYDITTGAFQTTYAGSGDVFVSKLNATGTTLIYSTYIGGTGTDGGTSITIDASGNAYITGFTHSTDYSITTGAFQTTYGGGVDIIVTKIELSPTTNIYNQNIISPSFVVYPNPSYGTFTLESPKGGVFQITDIQGKVLNTYTVTQTQQDIKTDLPKGIYLIREQKSNAIQKLIVE